MDHKKRTKFSIAKNYRRIFHSYSTYPKRWIHEALFQWIDDWSDWCNFTILKNMKIYGKSMVNGKSMIKGKLVGLVQFHHLEKWWVVKVNGKDDIPYMKWKIKNIWNHQPDDIHPMYLCSFPDIKNRCSNDKCHPVLNKFSRLIRVDRVESDDGDSPAFSSPLLFVPLVLGATLGSSETLSSHLRNVRPMSTAKIVYSYKI